MSRLGALSPTGGAVLWMGGALVSFIFMAIAGRALSAELSIFQILFFRSLVGLAVMLVIVGRAGWAPIRTTRTPLHLWRNVCHFAAQYGWFTGIALIPLAEVFALEFTTPIWTALLAALFLGERVTPVRALSVLLGFAGVLIILRPGGEAIDIAALAVLAGAALYAASYVMTKSLTASDSPLCILFYMSLIQLPLGLVPSLAQWTTPSPDLWPWVLTLGVTGLSAHYCLARALSGAEASIVVPIDFLRLPLIMAAGFLLFGEALDPWVLVGAAVIVAGNYFNVRGGGPVAAADDRP